MVRKKGLKLYGAPWYLTVIVCLIILGAMYMGGMGTICRAPLL